MPADGVDKRCRMRKACSPRHGLLYEELLRFNPTSNLPAAVSNPFRPNNSRAPGTISKVLLVCYLSCSYRHAWLTCNDV